MEAEQVGGRPVSNGLLVFCCSREECAVFKSHSRIIWKGPSTGVPAINVSLEIVLWEVTNSELEWIPNDWAQGARLASKLLGLRLAAAHPTSELAPSRSDGSGVEECPAGPRKAAARPPRPTSTGACSKKAPDRRQGGQQPSADPLGTPRQTA
uniref:Uncharacterized protein n=1 Tax=Sphaerodactylus townsendi TaxID=933632 RepID=A0ACB8F0C0_9SAUR